MQGLQQSKKTGWQKFKEGFGNFWGKVSGPIKGLLNFIPGIGSTLSSGLGVLENGVKTLSDWDD